MLTPKELTVLIQSAISAALAEYEGSPVLLDRNGLAKALSCSASHVDNMRKRGLPCLYVGEAPRFEIKAVLGWLNNWKQREEEKASA